MKLWFLDLDGPIVTDKIRSEDRQNKWGVDIFDPQCVPILNEILLETGAEIILSSDWRYDRPLIDNQEIFLFNKIVKYPISITPKHKTDAMNLEGNRADEIKEWLNKSNRTYKITNFVIVDDLDMSKQFPNNFVKIKNTMEGIASKGIKEQIINILNKN